MPLVAPPVRRVPARTPVAAGASTLHELLPSDWLADEGGDASGSTLPPLPLPPAPPGWTLPAGDLGPGWTPPTEIVDERPRNDRRMLLTALGATGIGAVGQFVAVRLADSGSFDNQGMIRASLALTLVLYALVAWLVAWQGRAGRMTTTWRVGDGTTAVLEGLIVGTSVAFVAYVLAQAAAGHPVVDPRAVLLVSERTAPRIALTLLLFVVVAPVVEEFLFRGLVLESQRAKGRRAAIVVSAVLFSIWHLNSAAFGYYVLMGAILGGVYWRRGLQGSMAAHASFNAVVVLAAVMYGVGPSTVHRVDGLELRIPAGWTQTVIPAGAAGAAQVDFDFRGPSGSELVIAHVASPYARVDLHRAVSHDQVSGSSAFGDVNLDRAHADVVSEPGFDGISTPVRVRAHQGTMVLAPRRDRLYLITVDTDGSRRAARDFEAVLRSIRFDAPTAATTGS